MQQLPCFVSVFCRALFDFDFDGLPLNPVRGHIARFKATPSKEPRLRKGEYWPYARCDRTPEDCAYSFFAISFLTSARLGLPRVIFALCY